MLEIQRRAKRILTCELQLAQTMVNQCSVFRARPRLLRLALDLVNEPAQRSGSMQEVADQIPGQGAEQVEVSGG